jgi:hypothetical protein
LYYNSIAFLFTFSSFGAFSPQVSGFTLNRMPALAEGSSASLPLATLLPQQFGNGKDHLVSALSSFRSNIIGTYLLLLTLHNDTDELQQSKSFGFMRDLKKNNLKIAMLSVWALPDPG